MILIGIVVVSATTRKIDTGTLSNEMTNPNSTPAMMPGLIIGSVTYRKVSKVGSAERRGRLL